MPYLSCSLCGSPALHAYDTEWKSGRSHVYLTLHDKSYMPLTSEWQLSALIWSLGMPCLPRIEILSQTIHEVSEATYMVTVVCRSLITHSMSHVFLLQQVVVGASQGLHLTA